MRKLNRRTRLTGTVGRPNKEARATKPHSYPFCLSFRVIILPLLNTHKDSREQVCWFARWWMGC